MDKVDKRQRSYNMSVAEKHYWRICA